MEMLTHKNNQTAALVTLVVSVVASIPFGFGMALIPVLFFGAANVLAALVIPSMPSFKYNVDLRLRREAREKSRNHLYDQAFRSTNANNGYENAYDRMRFKLTSLRTAVANHTIDLSEDNLEKLDDVTVEYLHLVWAKNVLTNRYGSIKEREIKDRIKGIELQMSGVLPAEKKILQKAHDELTNVLKRRDGLSSEITAMEAKIVGLADTFESVCQTLMTNPQSSDAMKSLSDAAERLQIEKKIEMEIEEVVEVRR